MGISLLLLGEIIIGGGIIIGVLKRVNPIPTLLVIIGSFFVICGVSQLTGTETPSAMDVYQGKTTLEITYKDGIPVDSVVVVFKDKEK